MTGRLRHTYVVIVTAVAAAFHLGTGAWAMLAPRSFYDIVATFPPYNHHLLHDIGAFLLGIGAALLAALVWRDSLFAALVGGTVAASAHLVSHVVDRHLGGGPADLWGLGALAVVLAVALVLRLPDRHPRRRQPEQAAVGRRR